jgi:hypothetical protein
VGLLVVGFLWNAWFLTDAGYTYVYQNNITGGLSVYAEPGVHFRLPGFSKVTTYKQVMTLSLGNDQDSNNLTRNLQPVTVRFADTYTGKIPATFRYKLSADAEKVIQMHREFRSFENLLDALIVKNSQNVIVITATQYTGEEFFQGGLNQFKSKLEDQLRNGIYQTERKQVEIEQIGLAPVGIDQEESNKLQRTKQLVWKTVPIPDDNGQAKRQSNPLDSYGIQVTQVTVGDPIPEDQLNRLLSDKKLLVAERIKTIQEQETAKAQAKTEQLKKEIERTRAVQDVQREKELAVITQAKEVEVAKQIALKELVEQNKQKDIAVINKQKELEIAEANRGIQKANSEAAKFEAMAIRETGNAEADVMMAKYAALGAYESIYLAEVQRDIAKQLYNNLANFTVEMPYNYVSTGGDGKGGLTSNLDIISAFGALGVMEQNKKLVESNNAASTNDAPEPIEQ